MQVSSSSYVLFVQKINRFENLTAEEPLYLLQRTDEKINLFTTAQLQKYQTTKIKSSIEYHSGEGEIDEKPLYNSLSTILGIKSLSKNIFGNLVAAKKFTLLLPRDEIELPAFQT